MDTSDFEKAQGHWLLARMGKRVLRPGGRELTLQLIRALSIRPGDDMVEFAPGLGFTAARTLEQNPGSYTGVDADEDVVRYLQRKIKGTQVSFIQRNAAQTDLPPDSKDKVYGEAMLTMQADHRKSEIIREGRRILKKGGLYGIHELGLTPDTIDEDHKARIQKDLAQNIRVNARPLTEKEWGTLLEEEGFKVNKIFTNPMRLLETGRIIDDEGFFRTLKIGFNIMIHSAARKRILDMRSTFRRHRASINAVAIIAEKI